MKLHVDLAHAPYDIIIEAGALARVGSWAASIWQARAVTLVTDSQVGPLYADQVADSLTQAGFTVHTFTFPEGEASKTLETATALHDFMIERGMTRSDGLIALGGGVVGDLAGFAASTYMRGLAFLQIPTSLTAQVDSSIGGKTGVNRPKAKNIIGTFAQPKGVLIDPEVLRTLGQRELIEGMGEVVKYGLIEDVALWDLLTQMDGSPEAILAHAETIIYHSCDVKRKIVVQDEFEGGIRMFLNFGHTLGHAIEQTAGYGQVMHGEAVAIGMVKLTQMAEQAGWVAPGLAVQIASMCRKFGLPTDYAPWQPDALYAALTHDKKARGQTIQLVLVPEIGQARIHSVTFEEMRQRLQALENSSSPL